VQRAGRGTLEGAGRAGEEVPSPRAGTGAGGLAVPLAGGGRVHRQPGHPATATRSLRAGDLDPTAWRVAEAIEEPMLERLLAAQARPRPGSGLGGGSPHE
jgi:hypothetical protein